MTKTTIVRPADPTLQAALWLALIFAAVKLLLTFALTLWTQHIGYGYFRDEFYYIACGHHLAWGFVDHGPIVAVQACLGEWLFGNSIFGIRVLSAVAGAATIFLGGTLTWAMSGQRAAQALAMFTLIIAPQYIGIDGFLSMNSYEPVFWMLCTLALLLLLRGYSAGLWWTVFGISAGLGLLNKPSMTFFLVALALGLLCTNARRAFFTPWAALSIALLIAIALPNLIWQVHNHWPTLEFLHNGRAEGKNTVLNPLHFFLAQFVMLGPVNAIVWIVGLVSLLRAKTIPEGRWLGVAYLFFYAIMDLSHAKDYYLDGIYPALFAAGGVAWERRYALSRWVFQGRIIAFPVLQTALLVTGLLILPMASPALRPETWIRYTCAMHLRNNHNETAATGPLPQFYADRFGWDQLTDIYVRTFRSLSLEDQKRVCLITTNYGEAGALDLLGHRAEPNLPPAVAPQNSYWMWGTHSCNWKVVIFTSEATEADLRARYESVEKVGQLDNPYAMPYEHRSIYLLRDRKASMPVDWNDWKSYI
jgi:hypothetical protein